MLDNSKSLKQEEGISIWKDNNFHGTLNYVPRFGKTRIIDLVCSRTRLKPCNIDKKILIIVPTEIAYLNVVKIIKDNKCDYCTRNSLVNYINNNSLDGYLLIIDEIHKFLEDKYIEQLSKLNYQYKLGLTGSTLTAFQKTKLRKLGFPVIDIITEDEAISKGWISDYEEYNVPIELLENEKLKYKSLNDNIISKSNDIRGVYKIVNKELKQNAIESDYMFMQACRSGLQLYSDKSKLFKSTYIIPDKFRLLVSLIMGYDKDKIITNEYDRKLQQFWNPDNLLEFAKSYLKSVAARNNYLKHNVHKVNIVLDIIKATKVPTIVYNESIEMIDQIYDNLNPKVTVKYHSQIESSPMYYDNGEPIRYLSGERKGEIKLFGKTTLKKQAIDKIVSGEALYLITGRSLNESLNLPNIELIICTAGDTNPITYEQRVARGKTINPNNINKKCIVINLYINDFILDFQLVNSRDKEKLIYRQENVKNTIWLENLNDLFDILKK